MKISDIERLKEKMDAYLETALDEVASELSKNALKESADNYDQARNHFKKGDYVRPNVQGAKHGRVTGTEGNMVHYTSDGEPQGRLHFTKAKKTDKNGNDLKESLNENDDIHHKLVHAVTEYDRKEEEKAAKNKKHYHNRYALPQYLNAIDNVHADIKAGHSHADAINNSFNGKLARHLHKALKTGDTDTDTKRRKDFNEDILDETSKLYGGFHARGSKVIVKEPGHEAYGKEGIVTRHVVHPIGNLQHTVVHDINVGGKEHTGFLPHHLKAVDKKMFHESTETSPWANGVNKQKSPMNTTTGSIHPDSDEALKKRFPKSYKDSKKKVIDEASDREVHQHYLTHLVNHKEYEKAKAHVAENPHHFTDSGKLYKLLHKASITPPDDHPLAQIRTAMAMSEARLPPKNSSYTSAGRDKVVGTGSGGDASGIGQEVHTIEGKFGKTKKITGHVIRKEQNKVTIKDADGNEHTRPSYHWKDGKGPE